ncbi:TyeA family type III secretion system gatekeeper subunit [Trinickia caryophylli]|uniref:Type III secretion regulator YopN/LcrE/InvE/MxiC n=1 Tax=Trinickia caryophylli TaxID=28094 RepID=A0A1X7EWB3_TRICW|nr:TyeA family type III secretion system gatekeeper subunit [Trinickia caryophylli]PMS09689.1 TyeA family type III secretion system gatekeeper subunit [Trinickia caryophylli]TRX18460.1 TyeA family type III secretion system gatekeeper subunit [Trinickia caryophylli]WQE10755.1 TyeA family type III secretion system gatekeeper subunit [Trinickia caryophylli]SMF41512.1 type III secretion regulator YopN/LcrE/InvE/MxiC [Trinickia caryophylli]GLU33130.1 type III secretion system protein SsaL [Trinicki
MIDKISPVAPKAAPASVQTSAQAAQSAQAAGTVDADGDATAAQIFPAGSALEMARSEWGTNLLELEAIELSTSGIDSESFLATMEDIGFAMGARTRALREGKIDRARTKVMLGKLGDIAVEQAEALHARVPEIERSPAPYDEMRRAGFDAGEMALLLGARLKNGGLSDAARRRLDDALSTVLDSEDWVLLLFGRLEFGAATRGELAQLRRLYQRAADQRPRLAQWFAQLQALHERKRKLKTLIRALAFELSAEGPATDTRLAAVIGDLKRIVQFLSIEDHCERLARAMPDAALDGDAVLRIFIEAVDQSWIDGGWVEEQASVLAAQSVPVQLMVQRLADIARLLPGDCFQDEDQRDMMLGAFLECLDMLDAREG